MPPCNPREPRLRILRLALLTAIASAVAQHAVVDDVRFRIPTPKPGLDDARQSLRRMSLPQGWTGSVWAAEPDVTHPVAFDVADDGRVFVAESLRAWRGVQDIRPLPEWLDEDIASKSVEDRLAMMRRHLGDAGLEAFRRNTERVRLLTDTDGDGLADRSVVFAEGFNTPLDGVASSVLARGNEVWFANIPDVWWLRDADGDGRADERRSLSHGHGVRISMLGHDLHGLVWGPDGRIYVSVGDRGSRVFHDGRWHGNPESGAVFRFEPDGSGFEMFAEGLRNPQELVFDDRGHLFTGDNSANTGDESRWVHVVEGGDSGWRIGWQWTENRRYDGSGWKGGADGPGALAPWNTEAMWHPQTNGQPAYIVPPVANISAGPCGVALYPGTGLGPEWDGTFVLSDFRGSSSGSGFWKFKLRPRGAGFELLDPSRFIWGVNATDGTWGPDGAFWLLDWTDGWEPEGRGRIHRFAPSQTADPGLVLATQSLLRRGFVGQPVAELVGHLGHRNRRVREGAQAELVRRWMEAPQERAAVVETLRARLAESSPADSTQARLHALWALGHGLRAGWIVAPAPDAKAVLDGIAALLKSAERDLRIQAARVLGDLRSTRHRLALESALSDADAGVRAESAIALGKLGSRESLRGLVGMLRTNQDQDATLRHAGVLGLIGCADAESVLALRKDPSESVRLAAVVALRRLQRNELEEFLTDPSARVSTEAARAIHDLPVPGALPALAARLGSPLPNWAFARRAINAALRTGTATSAAALGRLAADTNAPTEHRIEALTALGAWAGTAGRDRVTGLWRPLPFTRDVEPARLAVGEAWTSVAGSKDAALLEELVRAAGALGLATRSAEVAAIALDKAGASALRLTALRTLALWPGPRLDTALDRLLDDGDEKVRAEALQWATVAGGSGAVGRLEKVLQQGGIRDRQAAITALGRLDEPEARRRLESLGADLLAGKLPTELVADLLDVATTSTNGLLADLPARYASSRPKSDPLAAWGWALSGGDFDAGRKVYQQKASVECVRCHAMYGSGGQVGPDLTAIGTKRDPRYLLQAVVQPNAAIAPGFETVLLGLKDGETLAGTVAAETSDAMELRLADGTLRKVPKTEITGRDRGVSSMPEGFGEILSRRELRDLVAYLSGLR